MRILLPVFLLIALSSFGSTVNFSGTVSSGEDFIRSLPGDIVFALYSFSDSTGWTVTIHFQGNPEENFCRVVTPPFRGINPLEIHSWHFQEDPDLNAPRHQRSFSFVTSREDYTAAMELLHLILWPENPHSAEQAMVELQEIHAAEGNLLITETNLSPWEGTTRLSSLDFTVELNLNETE